MNSQVSDAPCALDISLAALAGCSEAALRLQHTLQTSLELRSLALQGNECLEIPQPIAASLGACLCLQKLSLVDCAIASTQAETLAIHLKVA